MAIDFSGKILVIHPTAYYLGRIIVFLALVAIAIGTISYFTGDILLPALAWFAIAVPTIVVGVILIAFSVTKP